MHLTLCLAWLAAQSRMANVKAARSESSCLDWEPRSNQFDAGSSKARGRKGPFKAGRRGGVEGSRKEGRKGARGGVRFRGFALAKQPF
jgi:hypothetical protein